MMADKVLSTNSCFLILYISSPEHSPELLVQLKKCFLFFLLQSDYGLELPLLTIKIKIKKIKIR